VGITASLDGQWGWLDAGVATKVCAHAAGRRRTGGSWRRDVRRIIEPSCIASGQARRATRASSFAHGDRHRDFPHEAVDDDGGGRHGLGAGRRWKAPLEGERAIGPGHHDAQRPVPANELQDEVGLAGNELHRRAAKLSPQPRLGCTRRRRVDLHRRRGREHRCHEHTRHDHSLATVALAAHRRP
jgi:hypothetical protein